MSVPSKLTPEKGEPDDNALKAQLDDLDQEIMRVRFHSPSLTEFEIVSQLTEMIESRNKLDDRLRAARTMKFKKNVQSLNLSGGKVQAVFAQSGCRCALILQDPRIAPVDETQAAQAKKSKKQPPHPWHSSRREFVYHRKLDVVRMLADLKKHKLLSIQEMAEQKRLEWELEGILQELK
jgi:hypothetical protein